MNVNLLKSQIALKGKSALYRKMYRKSEFTRAEISILITYLEIDVEQAMEIFFDEKVS